MQDVDLACHGLSTTHQAPHDEFQLGKPCRFRGPQRGFKCPACSKLGYNILSSFLTEVDIVEKILHAFEIYPECMLCPNGVGFAEHVPAEKHLKKLWEKLPKDQPVVRRLSCGFL